MDCDKITEIEKNNKGIQHTSLVHVLGVPLSARLVVLSSANHKGFCAEDGLLHCLFSTSLSCEVELHENGPSVARMFSPEVDSSSFDPPPSLVPEFVLTLLLTPSSSC